MKHTGLFSLIVLFLMSGCGGNDTGADSLDTSGSQTQSTETFTRDYFASVNGIECGLKLTSISRRAFCQKLADQFYQLVTYGNTCQVFLGNNSIKPDFDDNCEGLGIKLNTDTASTPSPTGTPATTVTPAPTATPVPTSTPDTREPIIRELEAEGVIVKDAQGAGRYPIPGQEPFSKIRQRFLKNVLPLLKETILIRKNLINQIALGEYTVYHSQFNLLTLDVNHTPSTLLRYFELFDRRVALEKTTNLFLAAGIEAHKPTETQNFEMFLDFFGGSIGMIQNLKNIRLITDNIRLDSYTSWSSRGLSLNMNKYQEDFGKFLNLTSDLISVKQTLATNTPLKIELDYDIFQHPEAFTEQSKALKQTVTLLVSLANKGHLESLKLNHAQFRSYYSTSNREIKLYMPQSNNFSMVAILSSFNNFCAAIDLIGSEVLSGLELDDRFIIASEKLYKHRERLTKAKDKINYLRVSARSSYTPNVLTVGYSDSEQDFLRVIDSIQ